ILRLREDIGGYQSLGWDKPASGGQPYSYKVYRAVATGYATTPPGGERSIGIEHISVQQRGLFDGFKSGITESVAKSQTALQVAIAQSSPATPIRKYSDVKTGVDQIAKYYDLIVQIPKEQWT